MRKKEESELEKKCCLYSRKHGIAAIKLEKDGHKGIPDRVFVQRGGKCLFIEFKKHGGGIVSKEQVFWSDYLNHGTDKDACYIIDSFVDFERIFVSFFN